MLLDRQGDVKAVVLGVGGFLGIGEKNVAVPMEQVKFVKNGDGADDYFLVVNANKQALNDAPAWKAPEETADAANDATQNQAANTRLPTPTWPPLLLRPMLEPPARPARPTWPPATPTPMALPPA